MRPTNIHWLDRVAWDGALPLITISIPWLLQPILQFAAELTGVITIAVIPFAATIVRCRMGYHQLEMVCEGRPTVCRQVLLAGAIVVLLFFEAFANGLRFVPNIPLEVWTILLGMYATYLLLVVTALRPKSRPAPQTFAFEDWELARRDDFGE